MLPLTTATAPNSPRERAIVRIGPTAGGPTPTGPWPAFPTMCELLALSANTPTDMRFSFHGLTRRGGATGSHGDGWGVASFDPYGRGVHLYREDAPAAFSRSAAEVAALDLRAHCSIAHIRKATQGVVALENCHPFHRRWHGQEWVFAHNGDLKGELPGILPGRYRPQGSTDSEAAFCWILGELERAGIDPDDDAGLFDALVAASGRLAGAGIFNCLISNGRWLYAYASTKLHRITRRAPFSRATLADDDLSVDFAELAGPRDVVTIVSTEPLTTDECWTPLAKGEALLLWGGEVVRRAVPSPPAPVPMATAARFWLRLGLVSFGGPAGQIALLHGELVERRRWLSEGRFLHALNYCMLLPGPEATQLATYLGWLMHGTAGALVAGGLFLLPSVAVLLSLSAIYALWGQLPALVAVFWALKPAVLGIVLLAAWRLGRRTLHHPVLVAIAVAACLALSVGRMPYPALIGATGLLGWIGGRLRPTLFRPPSRPAAAAVRTPLAGRVLHGDDDPTPDHSRFSPRRLGLTLLGGGLALGLPLTLLTLASGWDGPLATMARFFTRVALVSFGGAYAVLPYVAQGAVETHGWLDAAQMVDGLALGETTPGPLIMVVAFVGFMGGWNGSGSLAAGVVAALVVVWFSFLPSFLFILAGGPLVEASREDLRVGAPLTAITAAVVGVILSLAFYLAGPALAPAGGLDGGAAMVLVASLVLLGRGLGALPLIAAATSVGLGRWWLAAAG